MIKYDICFKKLTIGKLFINEQGQYKYVVNADAVAEAEKEDTIFAVVKNNRDWGDPIPFFNERIGNCKKFGQEDKVAYPNSDYYFIKDNH